MTPLLWQKAKRSKQTYWWKWKRSVEKASLKLNSQKTKIIKKKTKNEDHGIQSHHFMAKIWEAMETVIAIIFLGSQVTVNDGCSHEIKRYLLLGRKAMTNLNRHYFADKGPSSQSYGFSSSYVWMWELDYKESWVLKNWCFWTEVLEKTLEGPLDCKEIKPVHPEGNKSWIFIGRTVAETEILWPILWPLIWRTDSLDKILMLG